MKIDRGGLGCQRPEKYAQPPAGIKLQEEFWVAWHRGYIQSERVCQDKRCRKTEGHTLSDSGCSMNSFYLQPDGVETHEYAP